MKKIKRSKPTVKSVTQDVAAIKSLYDQFLLKGFTVEQAYGLTTTVLKLVMK